ncbi:hypothetical protein BCR34DRAFT_595632 [Clohesyomyces aquaticus]|uniref:Uncharacterized protein n=1 Tax=Clohesyomyces aquaticus TaxID=1231657 RepID=A0A1Y2A9I4_9PLEO|nr:hypothetical protein BCR34DRAFT_595632 [Clohesyomyces aquaticus]
MTDSIISLRSLSPEPPTAEPTALPPLFRLPRELRNKIYAYLLQGSNFEFLEHILRLTLLYSSQNSSPAFHGLPLWLLTCKQILSEALHQFHHHARCTQISLRRDVSLKWCNHCRPAPSQYPLAFGDAHLLRVHQIQSIELDNIEFTYFIKYPEGTPATLFLNRGHPILPLEHWLRSRRDSLRNLKLGFVVPVSWPAVYGIGEWKVDLSPIRYLGTPMKVEFVVKEPRVMNREVGNLRACATVLEILQMGLEDVARSLVGRKGFGWIVRDWIEEVGRVEGQVEGTWEHEWHVQVKRARKEVGKRDVGNLGLVYWKAYPHPSQSYERKVREDGNDDCIEWVCSRTGERLVVEVFHCDKSES